MVLHFLLLFFCAPALSTALTTCPVHPTSSSSHSYPSSSSSFPFLPSLKGTFHGDEPAISRSVALLRRDRQENIHVWYQREGESERARVK